MRADYVLSLAIEEENDYRNDYPDEESEDEDRWEQEDDDDNYEGNDSDY